jgi:hypothetical protein
VGAVTGPADNHPPGSQATGSGWSRGGIGSLIFAEAVLSLPGGHNDWKLIQIDSDIAALRKKHAEDLRALKPEK